MSSVAPGWCYAAAVRMERTAAARYHARASRAAAHPPSLHPRRGLRTTRQSKKVSTRVESSVTASCREPLSFPGRRSFGSTLAVDWRGVDQRHPALESRADRANRQLLVGTV